MVADEQSSWLQHLKQTAQGQAESLGAQSIVNCNSQCVYISCLIHRCSSHYNLSASYTGVCISNHTSSQSALLVFPLMFCFNVHSQTLKRCLSNNSSLYQTEYN